jgi:hypothetical protein
MRQITDTEENAAVTPAFVRWCMSTKYAELWAEVSLGAADRYFETSTTITADGSESYDEPEGHFATVRVAYVDASGNERDLRELRHGEESAYKGLEGDASAWALVDDQLYLYPTPSSGSYKWYYSQQPTDLSSYADGDVIDVVVPAGEAFFVWGVAAMILGRLKQDASFALLEEGKAKERLPFEAGNRRLHKSPSRGPIVDDDEVVYGADGWPVR